MSGADGQLKLTKSEILSLGSRGYKILKKINEGAFAKVYRSEYKKNKHDDQILLACKIMDISLAPPEFVRKFLPREVDALIRLRHPYLVHTHSIFLRRNKYFIFMRYMEHGDLLEYIMHKGAVPEYQARLWFRQLSLAVQYMHLLELAHRDIKCENVLLTSNKNAKLSDFGFCRSCVDKNKAEIVSATFCGSLSYTAPEIVSGRQYYPKPTDIWSLGIVLYVMLNKELPFSQTVTKALYKAQMAKSWKWKKPYTASESCKRLLQDMLDPLIETRPKICDVVNSTWFKLDPRFQHMLPHEVDAYNNACQVMGLPIIKPVAQSVSPVVHASQINLKQYTVTEMTPGTSKSVPKPDHGTNKEKSNKDSQLDSQNNDFYVMERNNAMVPIRSIVTNNDAKESTSNTKNSSKVNKAGKNGSLEKFEQKNTTEPTETENLRQSTSEELNSNQISFSHADNTKPSTDTYMVNTNNTLKTPRPCSTKSEALKKDVPQILAKTLEFRSINDNIIEFRNDMLFEENHKSFKKLTSELEEVNSIDDIEYQSEVKDRLEVINEREPLSKHTKNETISNTPAEAIDATTETSNSNVHDKAKLYISSTTTIKKKKSVDKEELTVFFVDKAQVQPGIQYTSHLSSISCTGDGK